MKFTIDDLIFKNYPDYLCGVVIARNINNAGTDDQILQMIKSEELKVKAEFNLENLAQHPFIQNWRKVYSSLGARPAEFRASSEALIRRTLKGDNVNHINKLVDIYNYISLKFRTPVGGEDSDKINGNLHLRFAKGNENFIVLGSNEVTAPDKGEVIYVDDNGNVLCRKWNWRESDITKLTEETKNAILVIDALPPLNRQDISQAVNEFSDLIKRFCSAETTICILTKENISIEF